MVIVILFAAIAVFLHHIDKNIQRIWRLYEALHDNTLHR